MVGRRGWGGQRTVGGGSAAGEGDEHEHEHANHQREPALARMCGRLVARWLARVLSGVAIAIVREAARALALLGEGQITVVGDPYGRLHGSNYA